MNTIEAYQKLIMVFASGKTLDFKAITLKIAQLHPEFVMDAIENPLPVSPISADDKDKWTDEDKWTTDYYNSHDKSRIMTIKALRGRRQENGGDWSLKACHDYVMKIVEKIST